MGKKRSKSPRAEDLAADAAVAAMDGSAAMLGEVSKVRTEWARTSTGGRMGPGGEEVSRRGSQLAMGHDPSAPRVPGAPVQHLEYQANMRPMPGADIASVASWLSGDGFMMRTSGPQAGPLASSIELHQQVVVMNHADGSQPHLGQQLADRHLMGIQGAPRSMPEGTSGNYPGQATGPAPRPEMPPGPGHVIDATTTAFGDRDLGRHRAHVADTRPPGSEYTSRVPGSTP